MNILKKIKKSFKPITMIDLIVAFIKSVLITSVIALCMYVFVDYLINSLTQLRIETTGYVTMKNSDIIKIVNPENKDLSDPSVPVTLILNNNTSNPIVYHIK